MFSNFLSPWANSCFLYEWSRSTRDGSVSDIDNSSFAYIWWRVRVLARTYTSNGASVKSFLLRYSRLLVYRNSCGLHSLFLAGNWCCWVDMGHVCRRHISSLCLFDNCTKIRLVKSCWQGCSVFKRLSARRFYKSLKIFVLWSKEIHF